MVVVNRVKNVGQYPAPAHKSDFKVRSQCPSTKSPNREGEVGIVNPIDNDHIVI